MLKLWKFLIFVVFGTFFQKNAFISSLTTTGQQLLVLLNLFIILINDVYRKIKKIHENLKKMENFAYFLIFGVICVSFWGPWGPCSQLKNSMNSSQLPTGNYILSLLTLFNVPINKVRQKFGKSCKKSLKNGKVLGFCRFWCQFGTFSI